MSSTMIMASDGMQAQQGFMASHTGNLANGKTDGFMPEVPSFATQVVAGTNNVTQKVHDAFYMEGPLKATDNNLDLGISGPGFLPVDSSYGQAFKKSVRGWLDKEGFYRDEGNSYVMGIKAKEDGTFPDMSGSAFERIQIDTSANTVKASTQAKLAFNLPADAQPNDTQTTEIPVYDSLGIEHIVKIVWTKSATPLEWTGDADVLPDATGTPEGTVTGDWVDPMNPVTLTFNPNGELPSTFTAPNLTITGWTSGAENSDIEMDLASLTQLGKEFNVTELKTDGAGFGTYVSLSVSESGVLSANYSNGEILDLWKIGLASFPAVTKLERKSNNLLLETADSGKALFADSGQGSVGTLWAEHTVDAAVDMMGSQVEILISSQVFSACSGAFGIARDCEEITTRLMSA